MPNRTQVVLLTLALGGCSSETSAPPPVDAGLDVPDSSVDAPTSCVVDASGFTCDLSTLTPVERGCTDWVQREKPDGGSSNCPVAFEWSTTVGGGCRYTWNRPGRPDPCTLPKSNGAPGPVWLRPACDGGCP